MPAPKIEQLGQRLTPEGRALLFMLCNCIDECKRTQPNLTWRDVHMAIIDAEEIAGDICRGEIYEEPRDAA